MSARLYVREAVAGGTVTSGGGASKRYRNLLRAGGAAGQALLRLGLALGVLGSAPRLHLLSRLGHGDFVRDGRQGRHGDGREVGAWEAASFCLQVVFSAYHENAENQKVPAHFRVAFFASLAKNGSINPFGGSVTGKRGAAPMAEH